MTRKFKPGDWVKSKGLLNAPKMQVLKYISKKDGLFGVVQNHSYVECIWYENGERKSDIFHQNKLVFTTTTGGLFVSSQTKPKTFFPKT
ncbi:hypothetical protein [Maribacter sp. LLG6340-A2]|uniref:hypothetical protein n=1 Tax=Maribacter sp. LLG6340-A2 TaxID=3160834 RepID=UPI00386CA606